MKKYLLVAATILPLILGGYAYAAADSCCVKSPCACVNSKCCNDGKCACKEGCCTKDVCGCAQGACSVQCGCSKK